MPIEASQAQPVPDWDSIRAAYVSHEVPARELASKFNVPVETLRKRIQRQGWRQAKATAVQVMGTVTIKVQPKPEKPQSIALRETVAKMLDQDAAVLSKASPRSVSQVAARQEVLSKLVGNSKVIHGWGESQQSTLISLGMLSGDAMPAVAQQPVIDLPSQSQEDGGDHKGETQDHVKPKSADSGASPSAPT